MFKEETVQLNGVETTTDIYSKLRVRDDDVSEFTAGKPGDTNVKTTKEPDVIRSYDTNSQYYKDILGFESTKAMADSMVAEYKAMSDSVKKYHGFYIGRYELTGTLDDPTVEMGRVLVNENGSNWYYLYKACQNVIKNNPDVKSTMIYGCQWDETMDWLKNTKFKNQEDKVDKDSSSWGNYSESTRYTGFDTRYKANEIFDLAGNFSELTQEAESNMYRIERGGDYLITTFDAPASIRGYTGPSGSTIAQTTRVTIYIQ